MKLLGADLRRTLLTAAASLGRGGRVLGVASRTVAQAPADREEIEQDLIFEGVLVFGDPVREEVPAAMRVLAGAGVGVSIVTGDQASTAAKVAQEAGIPNIHAVTGPDLAGMADSALVEPPVAGPWSPARSPPTSCAWSRRSEPPARWSW